MSARTFFSRLSINMGFVIIWVLTASTVSFAAAFYVATTGNDSSDGSQSAPFRTINKGVSILKPGDTLYVKAGTFIEAINNTIPSGTSWAVPVTLKNYGTDVVTISPPSAAMANILIQGSKRYIIIEGFVFDGTNLDGGTIKIAGDGNNNYPDHIRVQNCEIKKCRTTAVYTSGTYGEFINLTIHDGGQNPGMNGLGYNYGFYIDGSYNLIDRCLVYNIAGSGMQIYNGYTSQSNYNTVRNSKFHDNCLLSAANGRGAGIALTSGVGNLIYNNLLYHNYIGLYVQGVSNSQIYNNTVYGNTTDGLGNYSRSTNAIIRNNIAYQNGGSNFLNQGPGAIVSNNLTTDPKFTNATAHDFTLMAGSPAIDAGVSLMEVLDDVNGTPRPQGSGYDIGAYEYSTIGTQSSTLSAPANVTVK